MGLNYTKLTNLNVDSLAIGGVPVTATAAELNRMHGVNTTLTNLDVTKLSIGGAEVTATAAELNRVHGVTALPAEIERGALKVKTGALAADDTGGGVFSVAFTNASLIEFVQLIVTTKTTGACSVDCGVTSTSATTSADNLIDGQDINAATGIFDNIVSAGTHGKPKYYCPAGKWVTCSVSGGGASAGLVGTYKIFYREL